MWLGREIVVAGLPPLAREYSNILDGFAGKGHTVHLGILTQSTLFTETKYSQNVASFVDLTLNTVEVVR